MSHAPRLMAVALATALALPSWAQFAPAGPTISGTVGAQTLAGGTGTINAGGAISIATNGVALTMTGTSTLINNGSILTTGSGRAIDSNLAGANLTVTNAGLISSLSSDAFRVNTNSSVSLTNSGTIQVTNGGQAIDWAAITSASNTLFNLAGGVITTVGDDAVRPGTNGVVINRGTISATPTGGASPSGSDGIDVRTFSGIQITNSGLVSGRHGIATDGANSASTITITNEAGGTIQALNGSGINIDGVFTSVKATVVNQLGAIIKGGVLAAATAGDGDGIDVDGILTLTNAGHILGLGAKGGTNNAEGIAAGGGSIVNLASGRIVGSTLLADAPNGDPTRAGNGILIDDSNGGPAVAATTIINSGLIQGVTGFAIKLIGTFANTITNLAGGVIEGAGTRATSGAAVQTGNGNDTLVHAGTVIGHNGLAIDMQGGDNTLIIQGGAASFVGDVDGGAGGTSNLLRFALGAGNGFAYGGAFSNFQSVELESGQVTLGGVNDFSGAELRLAGGSLRIETPGEVVFHRLSLLDDAVIDLAGVSALGFDELGTVVSGKTLSFIDADASRDYAFRFLGDLTGDGGFLALIGATTINGAAARYWFDGSHTQIAQALQQVSEPATVAMLGFSLLLLVASRRRASARASR
jgi:hypothetical protein